MFSDSNEWVVSTKNTFVNVSFPRREVRRTGSCPAHWKTTVADRSLELAHGALKTYDDRSLSRSDSGISTCASAVAEDDEVPAQRRHSERSVSSFASVLSRSDSGSVANKFLVQPVPWWSGRVWTLAQHRLQCRQLQAALDAMDSEEERVLFFQEMQGHVNEASRCPHANYVLQKCISVASHPQLDFVIDEITRKGSRSATMVARHKYGCRIVQRLLERCSRQQVELLAKRLLDVDVLGTCSHPYGNYVMQHLYEHGTANARERLLSFLLQDSERLINEHQCAILTKVLSVGSREDKETLAITLPNMTGFTASIAQTEPGQLVVRLARRVQQRM